jgi:hypothetical protein
MFPNCQRVNRGNHKTEEVSADVPGRAHRKLSPPALPLNQTFVCVLPAQIITACKSNGFTDVIFVHETRGEPGAVGARLCLFLLVRPPALITTPDPPSHPPDHLFLHAVSACVLIQPTLLTYAFTISRVLCACSPHRWVHCEPLAPWTHGIVFVVQRRAEA